MFFCAFFMTWEMNIRFEFDISDLLSAEEKLAFNKQLPEFVAKTLSAALRDKAEKNARSKISNGGFGQELAEGVRTRANGTSVIIDHTSNDTNHLAEHVHKGGVIKPRNRQYLAIPIDKSVKKEYASMHSWATPNGKPLFIRSKEDGPRGRAYLAEPRGKRGDLKFLYVLVRETKPQRPRPWWPEDDDFLQLTQRETDWWLKKNLPENI